MRGAGVVDREAKRRIGTGRHHVGVQRSEDQHHGAHDSCRVERESQAIPVVAAEPRCADQADCGKKDGAPRPGVLGVRQLQPHCPHGTHHHGGNRGGLGEGLGAVKHGT